MKKCEYVIGFKNGTQEKHVSIIKEGDNSNIINNMEELIVSFETNGTNRIIKECLQGAKGYIGILTEDGYKVFINLSEVCSFKYKFLEE